jgi:alkaline phosphatase
MKKIFTCLFSCYSLLIMAQTAFAQPVTYTTANAHSHNDYEKPFPFTAAWNEGFGSVEADLHLINDTLWVAHNKAIPGIDPTFEHAYLQPLQAAIAKDKIRQLQLLIDIKTEAVATIDKVIATLRKYPTLINNSSIRFVISGGRPDPAVWNKYPAFIWFDGNLGQVYSKEALSKIGLLSADFHKYTDWNGKGRVPARQLDTIQQLITAAHNLGKPVRFWATPDNINAWYHLMRWKVDYLNTDRTAAMGHFLKTLSKSNYRNAQTYIPYKPTYKKDGAQGKVKNIILLIGDGTGLAHWYSGYTTNHGQLNVFNMRSIGLSKTSSYDNFITDSAPGATAFSSGEKTNNRAVGVDHTGAALALIPDYLQKKGMLSGLITAGNMTDATPAAFYGHQSERSNGAGMFADLAQSPVQLLMGAGDKSYNTTIQANLKKSGFTVVHTLDSVPATTRGKWIAMDDKAALSILEGRGPWLNQAFEKATGILSTNKAGFFLMAEGAQIDHGAHDNDLPYVATEVMDFDQLVGKAMEFADKNGETLVIVTADHETGGITLLDGKYDEGYIGGRFATDDHTAIPVPVFAYGPQSQRFCGVYENTAIFTKIMQVLGIPVKPKP